MSSSSKSSSGRPLPGQAREIVYNVYKYLSDQKLLYKLKYNVAESTSTATGVSKTLIRTVVREGTQSLARGKLCFSTPTGKKTTHAKKIIVDNFTKSLIRRKIHEFYVTKKCAPTISKLRAELERDNVLKCSHEYLRVLVKSMGFRWIRCQSRRKLLIEQPAIANWRANYIRDIRQLRSEGRNVVYVDETYINNTHIGVTTAIGKEPRMIVIHAGGEQGFVPNALRIWQSSTSKKATVSEDNHDDMDSENFSKWVHESLTPNLPPSSVVVMDNASYHNKEYDKKPTIATLKTDMKDWLMRHHVEFDESMTKPQLLDFVSTVAVGKKYEIDNLFLIAGHTVVRLPPYHADLNPIELVWRDIKGRVGENLSEDMAEKTAAVIKVFSEFTAEKWKKCCEHVYAVEENYLKTDAVMDERVDEMIIQFGENSDSESDSVSDSENEGARFLDFEED